LKGLSDFANGARERYSKAFMDCSDEEKLSYFKNQHDAVMDKSGSGYSDSFWAAMKKIANLSLWN
jgi:hypothetical protein